MSQPLAATATRAPAFRDHRTDHTHQADHDRQAARRTRLWTMIEALAYAGASPSRFFQLKPSALSTLFLLR